MTDWILKHLKTGSEINRQQTTDIFPTDKITDRFSKRVIWIKTDEQYPQVWEVQFANQNIDLLDNVKTLGEEAVKNA